MKHTVRTPPRWWEDMPALSTGRYYGMTIQRYESVADWKAALERVPEHLRADARAYLLDVYNKGRASSG